jgi:hypothetical protein
MVTFVSLFLWLMTGVHTVEVAVDPAVASVAILLDDETVGVARAPRWSVEVDFGYLLRPHELVAVARDEAGTELDRAAQVINLPRPSAEVEIVFEGKRAEVPTALRVITESAERLEPLAVFVTFNGAMLSRAGDGKFALPEYDPRLTHLVSAEAHFPDGVTARRDLTFGGAYGGRVTTELTAVAVVLDDRRELTVDDVQGLLCTRGEVLRVAAVERQGGRVYVVRDHRAWPRLRTVGYQLDQRHRSFLQDFSRRLEGSMQSPDVYDEIPPDKDRFYLVVPNPTRTRGLALYPVVQPFRINRWSLPWLATHITTMEAAVRGQQLEEAVAVAGLRAAGDASPRAVVIVLSDDSDVSGAYPPESTREYLKSLRVPLVVWSTAGDGPTAWGRAEGVGGLGGLSRASRRLLKEVRRQWIIWVEGHHLPNNIELSDDAVGIRLAG